MPESTPHYRYISRLAQAWRFVMMDVSLLSTTIGRSKVSTVPNFIFVSRQTNDVCAEQSSSQEPEEAQGDSW